MRHLGSVSSSACIKAFTFERNAGCNSCYFPIISGLPCREKTLTCFQISCFIKLPEQGPQQSRNLQLSGKEMACGRETMLMH